MVQLKEFRIVMPVSLDEYEKAQTYMIMKMQQQNTSGNEGVEVLENRPFENNVFGKGQYSSKIYRFQSKIPSWITSFASLDALFMHEEAWNSYPRCKSGLVCLCDLLSLPVYSASSGPCTDLHSSLLSRIAMMLHFLVIKCPYFSKLVLTIDTIHVADNGQSENVHGLSKKQLASREVEVIDIASSVRDYWSYLIGSCDVDFSTFRSVKTGRGPLLDGWRDKCNPVMTAYKLVTVDAPYWGFGKRLEQALLAGERALFLETHRSCFAWIDDWYEMTKEELRELEQQYYLLGNEEHVKPSLVKSKEALDQRCSVSSEDAFSRKSHLKCEDHGFSVATRD